jgi:DNA-binding transcriptional ArsR family regulator
MKKFELDLKNIKAAKMVFRAIDHPLRYMILQFLHEHLSMNVTELYTMLNLEQSVASQHLAILRKAGVVKTERCGKTIFYSINYSRINTLKTLAKQVLDIQPFFEKVK